MATFGKGNVFSRGGILGGGAIGAAVQTVQVVEATREAKRAQSNAITEGLSEQEFVLAAREAAARESRVRVAEYLPYVAGWVSAVLALYVLTAPRE